MGPHKKMKASNMNAKSGSSNNVAFFIRIGVLLAVLLAVGGAFAYDRMVLVPRGKEAVDRVVAACEPLTVERTTVHKAAGCEPTASENVGAYQVDDWSFGRILPNLAGHKVSVVYLNGKVSEVYDGGISDSDRELLK